MYVVSGHTHIEIQQHLFGAPGHACHVAAIAAAGIVAATMQFGAVRHVRFAACLHGRRGQVDDARLWHATALDALYVRDHVLNCKMERKWRDVER